jgi:secreted PhoX family phosphatase
LNRREFLELSIGLAAGVPLLIAAAAPGAGGAGSPYGELQPPDANGLMLPRGFRSRAIARAGELVAGTGYRWPQSPAGGATFARPDSGWIFVSNSEIDNGGGGVGAIRFDVNGAITDAYSIGAGTSRNAGGGVTPWRTWLSGEAIPSGRVWECNPEGGQAAVARPALGTFTHAGIAADPVGHALYMTEDDPNGRLYRFMPAQWGDLSAGTLEIARTNDSGSVTWIAEAAAGGTVYADGQGIAYYSGKVVFATTSDGRLREYDTTTRQMRVLSEPGQQPEIRRPGTVTFANDGDLYVSEAVPTEPDLVLIGADGTRAPVLRVASPPDSALTGVAFNPDGSRLYVSSPRGAGGNGVTYEVTGPFRQVVPPPTTTRPTTTTSSQPATTTASRPRDRNDSGGDGSSVLPIAGAAGGVVVLGLGALAWLRTRRGTNPA